MKVLQIVEQAFRGTGEEQDDTILWLSRSMCSVGADLHLLLNGSAAHYALQLSPAPALSFGDWRQTHPADISEDVRALLASGVAVSVVEEALTERGLSKKQRIEGVDSVSRNDLAALYDSVDQVWQW